MGGMAAAFRLLAASCWFSIGWAHSPSSSGDIDAQPAPDVALGVYAPRDFARFSTGDPKGSQTRVLSAAGVQDLERVALQKLREMESYAEDALAAKLREATEQMNRTRLRFDAMSEKIAAKLMERERALAQRWQQVAVASSHGMSGKCCCASGGDCAWQPFEPGRDKSCPRPAPEDFRDRVKPGAKGLIEAESVDRLLSQCAASSGWTAEPPPASGGQEDSVQKDTRETDEVGEVDETDDTQKKREGGAPSGSVAPVTDEQLQWLQEEDESDEQLQARCRAPVDSLGCDNCCNDGEKYVPCIDVEQCASQAPKGGRFALAYAQAGGHRGRSFDFLPSLREAADRLAERAGAQVDLILMMTASDAAEMDGTVLQHLETYGMTIREIPWVIPPKLKWRPSDLKKHGWFGFQDLIKLNALGFGEYRAIAVYDSDVEFQGDISPALLCASTGKFISASGGIGEPFNNGFFALRPHRRLLQAVLLWSDGLMFEANGTAHSGSWGDIGFAPNRETFNGAEAGQGFFHTFFYKQTAPSVRSALVRAGLQPWAPGARGPLPEGSVEAHQIDRCIWNYQHGANCPPMFDCERVIAHHKPVEPPPGSDCGKLRYRRPRSRTGPSPAPPAPDPAPSRPCETRVVHVGASCDPKSPTAFMKKVDAGGFVRSCALSAKNPSGDSFCISHSGSTVTAMRADANSRWCDGNLSARCCVVPP